MEASPQEASPDGRAPALRSWAATALYCAFFVLIFLRLFVLPAGDAFWWQKYRLFNVAAFTYPGGDARNIQMTSICSRQFTAKPDIDRCVTTAKEVVAQYPDAQVPPFNYPSVWIPIYRLVGGDSEQDFIRFWRLNALLLCAGIVILSWRFNYALLPLFLFSPITLFAVERGNVDATVFAVLFVPALSRNRIVGGLAEGLGAALKIFPLFAMVGDLATARRSERLKLGIGYLVAMPFMVWSFIDLGRILSLTAVKYNISYGLRALCYLPFFASHRALAATVIVGYLLGSTALIVIILRSAPCRSFVEYISRDDRQVDRRVLALSLAIFAFSDLLFVSFDYRLIFTIPAALVLLRAPGGVAKTCALLLLALHVVPLLRSGWGIANALTYAVAPLCWSLLLALLPGVVAFSATPIGSKVRAPRAF